jgi:cell division protein FtsI/penicillin-binding protein 2
MKPTRLPLRPVLPVIALLVAGVAVSRAEELGIGAIPPAPVPAAVTIPAAPAGPAAAAPDAPIATAPIVPAVVEVAPVAVAPPDAVPPEARDVAPAPAPSGSGGPPVTIGEPRLDRASGRYVAPLGHGRATLTLDARLQERLERSLETYRVPWGATVLIEPRTGRVLALAEYSRAEPGRRGIALTAVAPAASVFKIVTAAALLEKGIAEGEVCWHGGKRRLDPKLLRDDPRRDRRCSSLASAFGHSTNVVFAKLADRDLDPPTLRTVAERFLFNVPIAFPRPLETSTAKVPDDPFAAANTAAGFGAVRLSPLHGALLAAIVANGGVYVPPALVEDADGAPLPDPGQPTRVVDAQVAVKLAEMMRETVTSGTARKAFRRPGSPLRGIAVAGKTGSLSDVRPFRDYSWFVGYAPADRPEIAVATLIVNDRLWHARAPQVAREALEAFFATRALSAGGGAVRTAALR